MTRSSPGVGERGRAAKNHHGAATGAHAAVDGRLFERDGEAWVEQDVPGAEPARLAYGETLVVVDSEGTVHVAADPEVTHDGHGGWRSQPIGLRGVTALLAV